MSSPTLPDNYTYDGQIRRFLVQFAKIFSGAQVTKTTDSNGNKVLMRVPVQWGNPSRQAATAIANNSAATLPTVPMIAYYITGMEYDQKRTQDPTYVDKMQVRQRKYNALTHSFETLQGQAFTVERMMPVPYTMRLQVDIMVSNEYQRQEIFEQLSILFNPALEIQSTDNYIDWTSITAVFQDGITWTSKTPPIGTSNSPDNMSWKFYIPIWLSAPVKVKKMGVIERIVASIFNTNEITDMTDDHLLMGTRQKLTPYGYKVLFVGNSLQLLPDEQASLPPSVTDDSIPNTDAYWSAAMQTYGVIKPGISQMWLEHPEMDTPIVGTIAFNPSDDRLLIFNVDVDTLPSNTLAAVNSVILPHDKGPGVGLPLAVIGQRYLILDDILPGTNAWGDVTASANDIIEFDGYKWNVVFDSQFSGRTEFVTNLTSKVQYRFSHGEWLKSVEGYYAAGDWSVVI